MKATDLTKQETNSLVPFPLYLFFSSGKVDAWNLFSRYNTVKIINIKIYNKSNIKKNIEEGLLTYS